MTAKKFSTLFLGTILVLAIVSIALWNGVVSRTFRVPDGHGDLNRLGSVVYIPSDTPQYRPQQRHKEFRDYLQEGGTENFDVLTIGDSFSNGGGGAYYDINPNDQVIKSLTAVNFRAKLGNMPEVGVWCPEVESWPRAYSKKWAQSTFW